MMPENNNEERRSPRPNRGGDRPQGRPNRRDEGKGRPNDRRDNRRPDQDEERMEGKDFIYGARTVMEAMEAGKQIDKILLKKGLDSELRNDVYELARSQNIPIQVVPVEKLDRLTKGMNHQGVLAFTGVVAYGDLEGIVNGLKEKGVEPLLLMVDQVSDVRNFGGIVRTAECLGVHAIVIPEQGSARIGPDAMKASAGALNHVAVCRERHLQDAVYQLRDLGVRLVACAEKAATPLWETDLKGPICLVFGSEEKGITPRIVKSADVQVGIPMFGHISSLNVGVSVGVILAEVARQRLM